MAFCLFIILNLLQFHSWLEVSQRYNFRATAQWLAGEQRKGAGLRLLPIFSLFFSPIISHPCVPLTVQFLRLTGLLPCWFVISFPTPYCFNCPSRTFACCPLCPAAPFLLPLIPLAPPCKSDCCRMLGNQSQALCRSPNYSEICRSI